MTDATDTTAGAAGRPRVLVVEDTTDVAELVATALGYEGYEVATCADGTEVVERVASFRPELVILDVMLPGIDGFEVQRRLAAAAAQGDGAVPAPAVLLLTARGDTTDKVRGLGLGADDYVTKPFALDELLARVKRIVERGRALRGTTGGAGRAAAGGGVAGAAGRLVVADLELDVAAHLVTRAGEAIDLTPREFELLEHLMRNAGVVLGKDQLLDAVWHFDFGGETKVVDTYVSYLRRKLGAQRPPLLHTVRGVGYVLREARA